MCCSGGTFQAQIVHVGRWHSVATLCAGTASAGDAGAGCVTTSASSMAGESGIAQTPLSWSLSRLGILSQNGCEVDRGSMFHGPKNNSALSFGGWQLASEAQSMANPQKLNVCTHSSGGDDFGTQPQSPRSCFIYRARRSGKQPHHSNAPSSCPKLSSGAMHVEQIC